MLSHTPHKDKDPSRPDSKEEAFLKIYLHALIESETPQIIELLLLLIFLDLSYEDDHSNDCYYEFSALQSTQAVLNSGAHDILILIGKKKV